MEFLATGNADGTLTLGRRKEEFRKFLRENGPVTVEIVPLLPESVNLRRFYHAAIIPLWAYLDGKDYRDHTVLADLHELAKIEFNGSIVMVDGVEHKIGRSTKGKWMLQEFVERFIAYLEENYGIDRTQCLDPANYKHFIGAIYMTGKYETYIDFLVAEGKLKRTQ